MPELEGGPISSIDERGWGGRGLVVDVDEGAACRLLTEPNEYHHRPDAPLLTRGMGLLLISKADKLYGDAQH